MTYQVNTLKGLKRKLDIQLSAEQVKTAFDDSYRKKQKTVEIPGFRKGKAPLSYIRSHYPQEVKKDAALHLINKFYKTALEQSGLRPAGEPKIELISDISEDQEFGFSAIVEVHPEVPIDKNVKVQLSKPKILIEDKQVDQFLENVRRHSAKYEVVTEQRSARPGDIVEIMAKDLLEYDYEVSKKPVLLEIRHKDAKKNTENDTPEKDTEKKAPLSNDVASQIATDALSDQVEGMYVGDKKIFALSKNKTSKKPIKWEVTLLKIKKKNFTRMERRIVKKIPVPKHARDENRYPPIY